MSDKPESAAGVSSPRLHGSALPPCDLPVTGDDRVLAATLTGSRDDGEINRCAQYIRQYVNEEIRDRGAEQVVTSRECICTIVCAECCQEIGEKMCMVPIGREPVTHGLCPTCFEKRKGERRKPVE